MSTVSRTAPALSAIAFVLPGFGQAADGGNFAEEFTHGARWGPRPTFALRDVMHQTGGRRNLGKRADRDMVGNADAAAQHHEITERHGAGKSAVAGDDASAPDLHVVCDLHEIVDLG